MIFNANNCKSLPLQQSIRLEMDSVGLVYYKSKKIKQLPWLVGIAKDLDTIGCMTVLETKRGSGMDIAVYPDLSLKEVINSFVNDDGVAVCSCNYFNNLKAAAAYLRRGLSA